MLGLHVIASEMRWADKVQLGIVRGRPTGLNRS